MNTAVAISGIILAVVSTLAIVFKGGGVVIKHIIDLLTEMKMNTQAIKDVGTKIDDNFTATTIKLTDHECRITKLEDNAHAEHA